MAPWPFPFWLAHRGAGRLAPENTLAAFRLGAGFGYRAFECDVKLSADGVPFLLHDATLERTTPQRGLASLRTWSALSRLDAGSWHSPRFAGECVPSLETVARFCIEHGHALNVEIKPTPGAEAETGRVVAHEARRHWAGQTLQPLLSSFSADALAHARSAEPDLPRALLLSRLEPGWLAQAQGLGCVAVVIDHRVMAADTVAHVHANGLRVLSYTVNDAALAGMLVSFGIDGLITDAVDTFSPSERPPNSGAPPG